MGEDKEPKHIHGEEQQWRLLHESDLGRNRGLDHGGMLDHETNQDEGDVD